MGIACSFKQVVESQAWTASDISLNQRASWGPGHTNWLASDSILTGSNKLHSSPFYSFLSFYFSIFCCFISSLFSFIYHFPNLILFSFLIIFISFFFPNLYFLSFISLFYFLFFLLLLFCLLLFYSIFSFLIIFILIIFVVVRVGGSIFLFYFVLSSSVLSAHV